MPSAPSRARRWALLAGGACALVLAFVLGPRACRDDRDVPRTIVLLTIDTWRRDYAGFHRPGGAGATGLTPRLDAAALRGVRFSDARTPVPLTLPAHVTMLSGLPPAVTGVRTNAFGRLPDPGERGFALLPETLRAAGWRTGAFVSAEPLAAEHGLDHGFEAYDDASSDVPAGEDVLGARSGDETVNRALAWVRGLGAEPRVFLWVHLFEPHAPYEMLTYAGDVRQGDQVAGRLLDGLAAAGRGEAAVLVTSDHGEMLDELGERTHGHLLADAVLRVPFLLSAPGLSPGERDDPVDLGDVAPTLAALAGVGWSRGESPFAGRDLLAGPAPQDRVRVAESLFAHQRFRWAQVVSSTDASGGTLLDVGEGRAGWLARVPYGDPQAHPTWIQASPSAALLDALAAYKRGEVVGRMLPGTSSGGYGGGTVVQPFLPTNENAALANPYDEAQMRRLEFIDRTRAILKRLRRYPNPRLLAELLPQLEVERAADPHNPDLLFLVGLGAECRYEQLAQEHRDADAAVARAEAEERYGEAFDAGRKDADTLYRWVAVNAPGRVKHCLERLTTMGRGILWDAKLWALKALFHRAVAEAAQKDAPTPQNLADVEEHTAAAKEACAQARNAARNAKERAEVEKACAGL